MKNKDSKLPFSWVGAILNWLGQRDELNLFPTAVPGPWWRDFQHIADDMLQNGHGEARCLKCDKKIPRDQICFTDDNIPGYAAYDRFDCPNGHPLLKVETIRILC